MGKITEEELKRIESIRQAALETASILGELNYQKIIVEDQIDQQRQRVISIKQEEIKLFEEFKLKYGNVTINIETGEFS
jgi:hypothetical protein